MYHQNIRHIFIYDLNYYLQVDKNLLSEIPYDISLLAQRFDTELTLGNYINKYFYRKNR